MTDEDVGPRGPWRAAALVGVLLAVLGIGAALRGPWSLNPPSIDPRDDPGGGFSPTGMPTQQPDVPLPDDLPTLSGGDVPTWVGVVLVALVGAALVALVVVLVRRYWGTWIRSSRRSEPVANGRIGTDLEADDVPDLSEGTEAARRALEEIAEPRDAIVAAWVELEQSASDAGFQRQAWQTPTEFVHGVLVRTDADPAAVSRLRELYEAARFGTVEPGPDDVAEAALALAAIESSWRVRR